MRGETFFASALTGEESVLRSDFFFGFLGVADLPTVGGVATGGPGLSVGVTLDGATAIVVSEPWELARSAARFFFATGVGVASGVGGAPTK